MTMSDTRMAAWMDQSVPDYIARFSDNPDWQAR